MRVCLVRPPTFVENKTYPLGLEYISASLKRDGHDVHLVDAELMANGWLTDFENDHLLKRLRQRWDLKYSTTRRRATLAHLFENHTSFFETVAGRVLDTRPQMIGFSCYSSSMASTARITKAIRALGGNAPIVLGGVHPTAVPIEVMEKLPEADFVVVGEGEETIRELASRLEAKKEDFHNILGVCFRDPSTNKVTLNPRRPLIADLRDLPILSWDNMSQDYLSFIILTSRGCPFNCRFCASKVIFQRRVRYRPGWHVAEEVSNLVRKTKCSVVRFGDDTFTLKKSHMRDVLGALREVGLDRIKFSVGSRIDTMDEAKLEMLKDLVSYISFGVESGSQRISDYNEKRISPWDTVEVIKKVNEKGFESNTFFIVNHPTETQRDIELTRKLIRRLSKVARRNTITVNTGFPYPGTKWWEYCQDKELVEHIDFYTESYKYNHQATPAVNMTEVSTEALEDAYARLYRLELRNNGRVRVRRLVRRLARDPFYVWKRMV